MYWRTGLLVSRLDLPVAGLCHFFAAQLVAAAVTLFSAAAAGRSAALRPAAATGAAARRSLLQHPAVLARRVMVPIMAAERRFVRIIDHEVLIAPLAVAGLAVSAAAAP